MTRLLLLAATCLAQPPVPSRAGVDPEPPRMTVERIVKTCPKDEDALVKVYRLILGRKPTRQEAANLLKFIGDGKQKDRLTAYKDVEWALRNTREYLDRNKGKAEKPK
jgi:hypothetical protein